MPTTSGWAFAEKWQEMSPLSRFCWVSAWMSSARARRGSRELNERCKVWRYQNARSSSRKRSSLIRLRRFWRAAWNWRTNDTAIYSADVHVKGWRVEAETESSFGAGEESLEILRRPE